MWQLDPHVGILIKFLRGLYGSFMLDFFTWHWIFLDGETGNTVSRNRGFGLVRITSCSSAQICGFFLCAKWITPSDRTMWEDSSAAFLTRVRVRAASLWLLLSLYSTSTQVGLRWLCLLWLVNLWKVTLLIMPKMSGWWDREGRRRRRRLGEESEKKEVAKGGGRGKEWGGDGSEREGGAGEQDEVEEERGEGAKW